MPTNVVIFGVSTGGPRVLGTILGALPALDAAFIIVQHLTMGLDRQLVGSLNRVAQMPVSLAEEGEVLKHGRIYLVPGGTHLTVERNIKLRLSEGEPVNFVQPSVDVTMESICVPLPGKVIGVVLTGMGKDGAAGVRHIKDVGGITIAQDRESSAIYGMPRAAAETGAIDFVLSPGEIAAKLAALLQEPAQLKLPLRSRQPHLPILSDDAVRCSGGAR